MEKKTYALSATEMQTWRGLLLMNDLLVGRTTRPIQSEFGISEADFAVLTELTQGPDGWMRISDLASSLVWEKSRLSHQIGRMEKRDLVIRKECSGDKRGILVAATPEGRWPITLAAPRHAEEVRRLFFSHLSPRQIVLLMAITDCIIKAIRADIEAP
ncbi:MarR family winged helix-turn-helix transcriptional regulator [Streptomyces fulvorobeus]|uniref:MarR family transcriptional regulator n=1 Tax=Streptomyces fulvorobeus TaxID=284028 RepID=A0A7J0CFD4_9ACTN|nr:MarR family transcriptional regulator [Streptomyces fulvorobeus]NYE44655.1 DNA-binding MarR family transcriptional regulator [Streptomyces fulvorobeus]GFN01202.1 MarR family transcriptional regulator [Streptomyces fulvorobeus]